MLELKDYVALGLGLFGSALGVVNLARDIRKSSIRLTAIPYPTFPQTINGQLVQTTVTDPAVFTKFIGEGKSPSGVCVEVVNTGSIALHLMGCGLFDRTGAVPGKFYFTAGNEESKKFPLKIEASGQYAIIFALTPDFSAHLSLGLDAAFAELAGGKIVAGSSAAYENLLAYIQAT